MIITGIGSRNTPSNILEDMEEIGRQAAERNYWIRSGHAKGADYAFEKGAGRNCIVYLPWDGFNKDDTIMGTVVHESMWHSQARKRADESVDTYHPRPDRLGDIGRLFMSRNYFQIFGANEVTQPSDAVVCWTPDGKLVGGTAQAIRMAQAANIPVINLATTSFNDCLIKLGKIARQKQ